MDEFEQRVRADFEHPVETIEPEGVEVKALVRSVIEQFENYAKVNRKLPAETAVQLGQIEEPSKLADAVAANVNIKVSDKQALLAELDPVRRLEPIGLSGNRGRDVENQLGASAVLGEPRADRDWNARCFHPRASKSRRQQSPGSERGKLPPPHSRSFLGVLLR